MRYLVHVELVMRSVACPNPFQTSLFLCPWQGKFSERDPFHVLPVFVSAIAVATAP